MKNNVLNYYVPYQRNITYIKAVFNLIEFVATQTAIGVA